MKGRLVIGIVAWLLCTHLSAERMPAITMFEQNQQAYNPGTIGNQEVLTAVLTYREWWVQMPGAPSTQFFCAHAPLKNPNVALGVLLEHDATGGRNVTGAYFNYAYRIPIGMNRLAFGIKGGLSNVSTKVTLRDDSPDVAFNEDNESFILPNFGFGASYYGRNFWAGFSIPRMFGYDTKRSDKYKIDPNISRWEYFISGGKTFMIGPDFSIDPSALLVLSAVKHSSWMTFNTMASYKHTYKAGLGYRSESDDRGALLMLVSYCLNRQFSIGYSYDMAIKKTDVKSGTHEINIYYKFGYKVNAANPREF